VGVDLKMEQTTAAESTERCQEHSLRSLPPHFGEGQALEADLPISGDRKDPCIAHGEHTNLCGSRSGTLSGTRREREPESQCEEGQ